MGVVRMYPRLVVIDAAAAIDFYVSAMGAVAGERHTGPDGRIQHAELAFGPAAVAVKDEGDGDLAPPTIGGTPVIMALDVDDVDRLGAAMLAAGATVIFPIADQPYGFRGGRLRDPFGHQWMISTPDG